MGDQNAHKHIYLKVKVFPSRSTESGPFSRQGDNELLL